MTEGFIFNSPPGWPQPPPGWTPPDGWTPDPTWPPAPPGWNFWITASTPTVTRPPQSTPTSPPSPIEKPDAAAPPAAPPPPSPVAASSTDLAEPERDRLREAEAALESLRTQLAEAQAKVLEQAEQLATPRDGGVSALVDLDDERVLQEVGIYSYHHPLENSEEFRDRLRDLQHRINDSIKQGDAILVSEMFTFNNSLAKGRRMTSDLSKLMLRAYNAEADNCVRSLRAGNAVTAKKRLDASVASIARLGSMMDMRVSPTYHAMRTEEIELTSDFLMKVQEEKENAREERERLREERKAEQELAAERERLDKERAHFANALEALRESGDEAGIAALAEKIGVLDEAIAHNDYRRANIRAGYVYVISNEGAFGPNMVKIGLTRRLEPMDRVRELGDASVPFPFAVHALFFSDDAVTLENELHKAFAVNRVNHVNERREFFFATPQEVRVVLAEKVGNLLEFTENPEATQYMQSRKYWPEGSVAADSRSNMEAS
jgi:Domain of unknown function (DUF4041)/T5orf172 domain